MKKKSKKEAEELAIYDGMSIVAGLKYKEYITEDITELLAIVLGALDGVIIEVAAGRTDVGDDFSKLVSLFLESRLEEEEEEKEYLQ